MQEENKNFIIGSVVVIILAVVAFFIFQGGAPFESTTTSETDTADEIDTADEAGTADETGLEEEADEVSGPQTQTSHEINLEEQNNSGESGVVQFEALEEGGTLVTVSVAGVQDNPQPAHIHNGTCADLGGVEYPLNDLENGYSQTTVDVSLQELTEGEFAVNVHKSAEEIDVYTSCGNI